ncbi:unnamed protein product [Amoebophrya sp. A120]|nr:unnamed protein product [Amoebophrya sp. A120]|eukprot:GSA120T00016455001.1
MSGAGSSSTKPSLVSSSVGINYYEILGVTPTAKLEEIRDAYKRLALRMHPDRALINKDLELKARQEKKTRRSSASGAGGAGSTTSSSSSSTSSSAGAAAGSSAEAPPASSSTDVDVLAGNREKKNHAKEDHHTGCTANDHRSSKTTTAPPSESEAEQVVAPPTITGSEQKGGSCSSTSRIANKQKPPAAGGEKEMVDSGETMTSQKNNVGRSIGQVDHDPTVGAPATSSAAGTETKNASKGSVVSSFDAENEDDDQSFSCDVSGNRGSGRTKRGGKVNIEFYQVQDAWKTLSNPSRRFLYDMRNFGSSSEFPECDESYLLDLERAQAEKDLHQMSSYLTKVVTRETRAKGVIIMDAWYGDMSILSKFYLAFNERSSPNRVGEDGLYVDVRVATQCQVDYKSHRLIMSGGDSTSRSDLPGFYNPIPLSLRNSVELGLFIRYQFNDEVHEVLANDSEPIYIPKKSHTISSIAKRIRQDREHQKDIDAANRGKKINFLLPKKVFKSEKTTMAAHLGLCAVFAGLYLWKERDLLQKIVQETYAGLTESAALASSVGGAAKIRQGEHTGGLKVTF